MADFENDWLNTAGVNELALSVKDSKIVEVTQTAALANFPTLRQHILKLVSFDENGQELEIKQVVISKDPKATNSFHMEKPFHAVFLNYNDEGFVKIILDQKSKEFFIKNVKLI